ncbi:LysR family transcriptional regulator [Aminobacter sp. DSM 101952]|jgi:DNA-binding transcriptional LysR family regulator|uniref:LysR family transcriptional regulator n=2 Tax=Brucella TaxID=234 RepID=A0A6L3Y7U4_9HYPH|nr:MULTISPECIES: LysR substrate-binding domain-containing protein [Hyphomicrobiales]KAB2674290.1 LysR family transcriptional regulator [Brucella tritici]KQU70253.1 LysR family transcriptional regulator [Aminobacter sp. DSM 101952]MBE0559732.1 LysR family transcriptional regulator [Brucella anthropi]
MSVRFSQVEAFRAVMVSGSMTAAAEILHTSQPNVSRSISQLEKATGLRLFDRLPGKLVPTNDGMLFFKDVQRSFSGLRQLDEAAKRIRRFSGGSLTVAAIQILALGLVPRTIKRFAQEYPETSISIHTGHSSAVTQWVDDQTCDVGIVSQLSETFGLDYEQLYEVDAVCVMPRGHRLEGKACIGPEDLAHEPYISFPRNEFGHSAIDAIFEQAGISRHINLETSYSSITCSLVAQGLGIAIVNPFAVLDFRHAEIVTRPFLPAIKHNGYLIFPKARPVDRLVASFVATLKATMCDDSAVLATLG